MRIQLSFTVLSALFLAGCGKGPEKTEAAAPPPVAVHAAPVVAVPWTTGYEASGTVRARTAAAMAAKVMGYVREVKVQAGDRVRAGQVLVVLDARDLETGVRRAEAGQQEARAALPEVESGVAAAQANLELAEVTFKRMQELFSKKSISNQEFDEAQARVKAARANHQMAVAKRAQLAAKMAQAAEERASAGIMQGYATITAPFAGVVTERTVEPGSLAAPGAPLLTIEREGAYRLEVPVEESQLGAIRIGQPVAVSIGSIDRAISGRVSEIVPAVDAASRAYTVKIDLPAPAGLRSGMFGRATFTQGARQALAVPTAAVSERGQLESVLVAEDGVARTRLVTLGRRQQEQVEVLSGLHAGDKVIAPVPPGLADGARVEVRP